MVLGSEHDLEQLIVNTHHIVYIFNFKIRVLMGKPDKLCVCVYVLFFFLCLAVERKVLGTCLTAGFLHQKYWFLLQTSQFCLSGFCGLEGVYVVCIINCRSNLVHIKVSYQPLTTDCTLTYMRQFLLPSVSAKGESCCEHVSIYSIDFFLKL